MSCTTCGCPLPAELRARPAAQRALTPLARLDSLTAHAERPGTARAAGDRAAGRPGARRAATPPAPRPTARPPHGAG